MSRLKNSVKLIGRLGKDPEFKSLENGTALVNFSIATSEKYKNAQGETVEETQWHNIVAWRKLAEIVNKYCTKGDQVAIEGKLVTRSYDNAEGVKKYITEIVARDLLMLSSKKESAQQSTPQSSAPQSQSSGYPSPASANNEEEDDLPF